MATVNQVMTTLPPTTKSRPASPAWDPRRRRRLCGGLVPLSVALAFALMPGLLSGLGAMGRAAGGGPIADSGKPSAVAENSPSPASTRARSGWSVLKPWRQSVADVRRAWPRADTQARSAIPVDWSAAGIWWSDTWVHAGLAPWMDEDRGFDLDPDPADAAADDPWSESLNPAAAARHADQPAGWWQATGLGDARRKLWSGLTDRHWPDTLAPAGDTALCLAVRTGDAQAVRWLLTFGADASLTGREGQPPLWLAVARRDPGVVRALLEGGAEADILMLSPPDDRFMELFQGAPFQLRDRLRNDSDLTPLMAAAALGDYDSCEQLLAHGARTSVHTGRWKSYAINFAAHEGHVEVMQLLLGRPPGSGRDDIWIKISLVEQRAWLLRGDELLQSSPASTGRQGHETPTGTFVITNKHTSWTSNIYHVRMPHFMRLNCGPIGLHAGHVPGRPASAGCIRLPPEMARRFYQQAQVGHRVVIVE